MVSQLDRDTSTMLANISEWRNSFVPINRFPLEVLSYIPTQLSSDNNVSNACLVYRHWYKTLFQHAALWPDLNLTFNLSNFFIRTRLERVRGFVLELISGPLTWIGLTFWPCLPLVLNNSGISHSSSIVSLTLNNFPKLFPDPCHSSTPSASTSSTTSRYFQRSPTTPLFGGAVNLKYYSLCTEEAFPASQLLDFLEPTPMPMDARLVFREEISLAGVLPGRIVVLPNVESFFVIEEKAGSKIATHTSCSIAKLIHKHRLIDTALQEAFFTSATWNTASQHMMDQIDEAALESIISQNLSCSLSFLSSGSTTLELGYTIFDSDDDEIRLKPTLGKEYVAVFSQACKAIRNHPLLANFGRLRIQDWRAPIGSNVSRGRLHGCLSPFPPWKSLSSGFRIFGHTSLPSLTIPTSKM